MRVACGSHGNCSAGNCTCRDGYSGSQCEHNPCAHIDCGNHGSCSAGNCVCTGGYTGAQCSCNAACQSFLAFKASGNGQGLESWINGTDPCGNSSGAQTWAGVTCIDGVETRLNLQFTHITGDVAQLSKGLSRLTHLDLRGTGVTGNIGPFGALTQLIVLELYGTGVTGDIASLKKLTQLTDLDVGGTGANGDVVHGDVGQLQDLTQLTTLGLGDTEVFGEAAQLKGLTHLADLVLAGTNVTGCPLHLTNGKTCHCATYTGECE